MDTSSPSTVIDAAHPFYINTGDHPGLMLVSVALIGDSNYHSWSRSMEMALLSKNKLEFVDGSISSPVASDPTFPAWRRANLLVLGWLHRAVSPDIAQSVLRLDSAREVWVDLRERFSRTNLVRAFDLYDQICSFRQGALSISAYYMQFKVLWDEYMVLRPIPSCSCKPRCSCGAFSILRNYWLSEQIIRFLRGLDGRFSSVRSQILRMEPLPSINQVFSMVSQDEHERNLAERSASVPVSDAAIVLASGPAQTYHPQMYRPPQSARRGMPPNFKKSSRPVCTYCGGLGHTIDRCFHN
ncbi:Retrovirus-related Pol polyprotein from transposon RE1 [Linum perenne]